jgi:hypothetical protein
MERILIFYPVTEVLYSSLLPVNLLLGIMELETFHGLLSPVFVASTIAASSSPGPDPLRTGIIAIVLAGIQG